MKNYEVQPMLKAANEIVKLKSSDLDFVMKFLKIKKDLESKNQEFQEIIKQLADFTKPEEELLNKIQSGEEYDSNSKIVKSLEKKNLALMEKQHKLLSKDCDLAFEKLNKDTFPDGCLIQHFEAFYNILT